MTLLSYRRFSSFSYNGRIWLVFLLGMTGILEIHGLCITMDHINDDWMTSFLFVASTNSLWNLESSFSGNLKHKNWITTRNWWYLVHCLKPCICINHRSAQVICFRVFSCVHSSGPLRLLDIHFSILVCVLFLLDEGLGHQQSTCAMKDGNSFKVGNCIPLKRGTEVREAKG